MAIENIKGRNLSTIHWNFQNNGLHRRWNRWHSRWVNKGEQRHELAHCSLGSKRNLNITGTEAMPYTWNISYFLVNL